MLRAFILGVSLLFSVTLAAQLKFEGLWEGTITIGGIHSQEGYPVQFYLEREGKQISGRSYVHLNEDRIVEMRLTGYMHDDLSVSIEEVEYIDQEDGFVPDFLRKYQFIWRRSLGGSSINGYWQEIRREVFDYQRERGRIFLKRVKDNKA